MKTKSMLYFIESGTLSFYSIDFALHPPGVTIQSLENAERVVSTEFEKISRKPQSEKLQKQLEAAQKELTELEEYFLGLVLLPDEQLGTTLASLLPNLLRRLTRGELDSRVRDKIIEMLTHIKQRIHGTTTTATTTTSWKDGLIPFVSISTLLHEYITTHDMLSPFL
ncbi:hypothetical protein RFI_05899 [Reticulomyxa filosa]|uniref:Uncharacterized protein n=1 Tax=Reticulomyxa filosa TaxID=46433 RepID=X6NY23_RETFI|nr:hypothetical protein RFI_05899 [Reticulomyxa filosa]|eukprot:ETO31220.1 hypothetical protein RFI_05899 [Reticulomyxa filosa]